ncbi:50S ribosomal protein L22, chloroplastic [Capsicum baccatum]|uniref:Uncharacterized protein ycf68 n=1 Tax=Capsicum baccatum TaxID=33114 RepID=A0A2G2WX64_CAPBA|nr:50S ribosomal protein L22, chloroplastic [Capsicum baccatum]
MSADKARRVIDQISGRSYEETLMILELKPYRACYSILKLVYSATENASYNIGSSKTNLVISKAEVNGEKGDFGKADTGGAWLSSDRVVRLPVISRRKMRMMSSHHAPYALGDTHAIMARTKGRNPARDVSALSHMDSLMCSSVPDLRCGSSKAHYHGVLLLFESEFETKLLLKRIDGAIWVRYNVDPTFDSLVGSGRSEEDHHSSSLLENPYIPY